MHVFQRIDQEESRTQETVSLHTHVLTPELKEFLRQELREKTFIHTELERLLTVGKYVTVTSGTITLHYIPIREITQTFMKKLVRRLVLLTRVFQMTVPVSYWILPCRIKRFFPARGEIREEHINGGYTYTHQHTIFIYRLEEFPKVAIHELLHNSPIHTEGWKKEDLMALYQAFHIDTKQCDTYCHTQLTPNEAIVEAWSLMVHLYFVAKDEGIPWKTLYDQELAYNLSMSHKLWVHQKEQLPLWKERTHSYSYIRFKTCLLYYWKVFSKIPYPYDPHVLTQFFLDYNSRKAFVRKIRESPLPEDTGFRMTRCGDR